MVENAPPHLPKKWTGPTHGWESQNCKEHGHTWCGGELALAAEAGLKESLVSAWASGKLDARRVVHNSVRGLLQFLDCEGDHVVFQMKIEDAQAMLAADD